MVEPYARKTTRLHEILRLVGFALGGEPGTRLLWRLGMMASPSTLLRYVRGSPDPVHPEPHVVGIDDWASRRGRRYGTMIVDLEHHEVIDLLEDRETGTVRAWLELHPQIWLRRCYAAGSWESLDGIRWKPHRNAWHLWAGRP
jgi:hypothetical protein